MYKLLIITALYTGHGHKSISDALEERFERFDDLEVRTIDGFDLMNRWEQELAEKTYGPITRLPSRFWELNYAAGVRLHEQVQGVVSALIRQRFEALINAYEPDCILSVHPIFLSSITRLIAGMGRRIPVIAHEADLIDIANYWFDPNLALLLAPSQEAWACSLAGGVRPEKLRRVGFPIRRRFIDLKREEARAGGPMRIAVMSGSEGSGTVRKVAGRLLKDTDAVVTVVCGRNTALRKKLKRAYHRKYRGRLTVLGFVGEIEKVMSESDILVMRASPNSVMEAVALRVPVILFGQLAGQELHNPQMLESHGIALYCPDAEALPGAIDRLTRDDGAEMARMRACQAAYQPGDAAEETAELIRDWIRSNT